jgi:peptidoglycan hydrolase CwlO-like protein
MRIHLGSSLSARVRRLGAGLLVLALVAIITGTAGADTQGKLNKAEQKLSKLESLIQTEQQKANAVKVNLVKIQAKVDSAQSAFDSVDVQLINLRDSLALTQADYDRLQGQVDAIARDAYMNGPGSNLEMLLGASSMGDLNDRLEYMTSVSLESSTLANEAQTAASQLGDRKQSLDHLLARQADLLRGLNSSRTSLSVTLDAEQTAIDDLNKTREQIVSIIGHLSAKLQQGALNGAGGILQGHHNAPYGVWAASFLNKIGAPTCFDNLVVMVAWQVQEGTQAAWNPLATTYPMQGATNFNSIGVKNYISLDQGLEATQRTLGVNAYGYPAVVADLHRCPDSMVTARAVNASSWCRGCTSGRYLTGLIPTVEAHYETYSKL